MINQSHSPQGCQPNLSLFAASNCLCLEGYNIMKHFYANSTSINHASNLDNTISFFNLEHQTLQFKLRKKYDNCFCYGTMTQMIQCKHMASLNHGFSLNLIGSFCHKRDKITQSINVSSYISPKLKKYNSEIDDIDFFQFQTLKIWGMKVYPNLFLRVI